MLEELGWQDSFRSLRWLATLDEKTPLECGVKEGRLWTSDKTPVDHAIPWGECGCGRCVSLPVALTLRELGIDVPEMADRASRDGPVPADMAYGEWIEGQRPAYQVRALGNVRAGHLGKGFPFESLFTASGIPIPISEIGLEGVAHPPPAKRSEIISGLDITVTSLGPPDHANKRAVILSTVCKWCGGYEPTFDSARGEGALIRCSACDAIFGTVRAFRLISEKAAREAQAKGL